MVLRPEVLGERLAALREVVERLRQARERDLDDPINEWAIERGLQIAAQAVFDIGNHVLAGAFGERPTHYGAVASALLKRGVLDGDLSLRLEGLSGFRNLLVHDYARVDPQRVRALVESRLDDFEAFARAIEHWLNAQPR